jgi:hypothetical protein
VLWNKKSPAILRNKSNHSIINLKVNNSADGFTDAVIEEAKKDDKIILVELDDTAL